MVYYGIQTLLIILFAELPMRAFTMRPLVVTSEAMLRHRPSSYHPECPERISSCLSVLQEMTDSGFIRMAHPTGEAQADRHSLALDIIKRVHSEAYVKEVKTLCERGARVLDPWDADTYISRHSFEQCVQAQTAWLDCVDEVVTNKNMAFSVVRPPGHHALKERSMGFCIFNFAVGAATYALENLDLQRVGILDFDVHFGNGVAALVSSNSKIRYTSLHQSDIFPHGGQASEKGDHNNLLNLPLPAGTTWTTYSPLFVNSAIPFLKEFEPQLVIVCAGYDALGSDEMAGFQLSVEDYHQMALEIRRAFGPAVLFGLEGGYNLEDLPKAVKQTLLAFTDTATAPIPAPPAAAAVAQ